MRRFKALFGLFLASPVLAGEPQWAVVVYGENYQMISAASATAEMPDGQFLADGFTGKEIFVRSQQYYELDQFRPANNAGATSGAAVSSAAEAADMAAAPSAPEAGDMSPFGPLADTGVVKIQDGHFLGWYCDGLFVTPLGGRQYKLSCAENMSQQ